MVVLTIVVKIARKKMVAFGFNALVRKPIVNALNKLGVLLI
ncbi:hypothetical protein J567_4588, partial [Acinetobacter baumannii 754286]